MQLEHRSGSANGHTAKSLPDRLPPHNLEAEKGVLCGMIADNRLIPEVFAFLKPAEFYRAAHQVIAEAVERLYSRGVGVDLVSLMEHLETSGQYAAAGGDEYVLGIMDSVASVPNTVYHAGVVKDKALARLAIDGANVILREAYSGQKSGQDVLLSARSLLDAIKPASTVGVVRPMGDLVGEVWSKYVRRQQGEVTGIQTGYSVLDDITDGLQRSELTVVAGRPSMGKSAWGLNVCEHVAIASGRPAMFISLEMSELSLTERCIVGRARIDGQKIRRGQTLDPAERERTLTAMQQIEQSPLLLVDRPNSNYRNIARKIREAKASHGIELAVVDYLQLMTDHGSKANTTEQLDAITEAMKSAARENKIPVILVSQLNRALESRTDKRPMMSDLRGSGAIEQHADLVLFLYRSHYYNPSDPPGVAELIIGKNRNGPTGRVDLAFLPESTRFENLDWRNNEPPSGAY